MKTVGRPSNTRRPTRLVSPVFRQDLTIERDITNVRGSSSRLVAARCIISIVRCSLSRGNISRIRIFRWSVTTPKLVQMMSHRGTMWKQVYQKPTSAKASGNHGWYPTRVLGSLRSKILGVAGIACEKSLRTFRGIGWRRTWLLLDCDLCRDRKKCVDPSSNLPVV